MNNEGFLSIYSKVSGFKVNMFPFQSPAIINFPFGDQSNPLTSSSNYLVPATIFLFFKSHILIVLSPPEVANFFESGSTVKPHTKIFVINKINI